MLHSESVLRVAYVETFSGGENLSVQYFVLPRTRARVWREDPSPREAPREIHRAFLGTAF
jgi:hypothetical protein